MTAGVIHVEGYKKAYPGRLAVDGLSFDVRAGEVLGLVGPNGAGKTTTLRAVAGILEPSAGRIVIAGHDLATDAIAAKRELAIVPDDPKLFSHLTVWEHLEFTALVYGVPDWRAGAQDWLGRLRLEDRRDTLADELSRGMRQKVAVACALLHDPRALLLDEPLTGLDPRGIRTLFDALRTQAARGAAVMLSSHLLGQIEGVCSRFLILAEGRKVVEGTVSEIRAQLGELRQDTSLEEIFFQAVEGPRTAGGAATPATPAPEESSAGSESP